MRGNPFNRLARRAEDVFTDRWVMEAIGQAMVGVTEDHFRDQSSPDGEPWEALAASTKEAKGKNKTLAGVNSGRLLRSLDYEADATEVRWGSNLLHGYWFQKGTKKHVIRAKNARALRFRVAGGGVVFRRSVNHPGQHARPYLGIGEEEERAVRDVTGREMRDLFCTAGGNHEV